MHADSVVYLRAGDLLADYTHRTRLGDRSTERSRITKRILARLTRLLTYLPLKNEEPYTDLQAVHTVDAAQTLPLAFQANFCVDDTQSWCEFLDHATRAHPPRAFVLGEFRRC
jgi:hypothetical protein